MAIELAGVGRAYGERVVLRDVNLSVPAGATLAVFGANGAGKTTLLRMLAGLLRAQAGTVRVLGKTLPREAYAVRGRIGLLGHEPMLYRDLSIRQNLEFHARMHGIARSRIDELLEAVGMRSRAQEPVRSLSRGMTQRVAVARTVLHEPDLLLLDEPYANLDPGAAAVVAPLLARGTRVLISHDVDAGLREADLVLGLKGARVAFVGEADAARVRELYA
jgi:heme exporter protein A